MLSFSAKVQKDTRPGAALDKGFQTPWWAGQSFIPWQPCHLDQSCDYWLTLDWGPRFRIKDKVRMEPKPRAGAEMEWDRSGQGKKWAAKLSALRTSLCEWMGNFQVIALLKAQDLGEGQGWEKQSLEFKLFQQSLKGTAKSKSCLKKKIFLPWEEFAAFWLATYSTHLRLTHG